MSDVSDRWAAGSSYESFMGRWSRQLATQFVASLPVAPRAHWLDVGCGTGALADAICRDANPETVVACDPATPFIEFARNHSRDSRIAFVNAGTGSLPPRAGGYDCVASLLALNFFPDAEAALQEMCALAARPGQISACVWDYGDRMEFLRHFWDAAAKLDSTARDLDEGTRFPLCRPVPLERLFRTAGLLDVRCEPVEIQTVFNGFSEYWEPFLGGTGPAPSYVASLDTDRRQALTQLLQKALPSEPGGNITLAARAWMIRGTASR